MASGTGVYGDYAKYRWLVGLTGQLRRAECINTSGSVVMSDLLTIAWVSGSADDTFIELNVSGGVKVFTVSQAGTINAIRFKDASGNIKGYIDVDPVIYSTPTYYTLSSLTLYFD